MSGTPADAARASRPLAVVGSQVSHEEEMFGAAFDGVVLRRFWRFVRPYRRMVWLAVAGGGSTTAERLQLDGDRDAVRAQTVAAALARLLQRAGSVS